MFISHLHRSIPSLSLSLSLLTVWPSHYTWWIIEVKPSTLLRRHKSRAFSLSFCSSPLTRSPLCIDDFAPNFDLGHQIRSQGNMRFYFLLSLELILRTPGRCTPAAQASLVTAGGRVLEDGLIHTHTHSQITLPAGLQPSLSGAMVLAARYCIH